MHTNSDCKKSIANKYFMNSQAHIYDSNDTYMCCYIYIQIIVFGI